MGFVNRSRRQQVAAAQPFAAAPVAPVQPSAAAQAFAAAQPFASAPVAPAQPSAPTQPSSTTQPFAAAQPFAAGQPFAPASVAPAQPFTPAQPFAAGWPFAPAPVVPAQPFAAAQTFAAVQSSAPTQAFAAAQPFAAGPPFAAASFAPAQPFAAGRPFAAASFAPTQSSAAAQPSAPAQAFAPGRPFAPAQPFAYVQPFATAPFAGRPFAAAPVAQAQVTPATQPFSAAQAAVTQLAATSQPAASAHAFTGPHPSLTPWIASSSQPVICPLGSEPPTCRPATPPAALVAARQRVDAAAERLRGCLRELHQTAGTAPVEATADADAPADPFLPPLVLCVHRLVRTTVAALTQTREMQPVSARRALLRHFIDVAAEWDANGFVDLQHTGSVVHGDVDPDVIYLRIALGSYAGQALLGYFPFPLVDQIMHVLVQEPALLIAAAADLGAYYRRLAFGFAVPARRFGRADGDAATAAALSAQQQRCEDRAALFAKVTTARRCDASGFLALRHAYQSGPYDDAAFMRDPLRTQVDLLAREVRTTLAQLGVVPAQLEPLPSS